MEPKCLILLINVLVPDDDKEEEDEDERFEDEEEGKEEVSDELFEASKFLKCKQIILILQIIFQILLQILLKVRSILNITFLRP